VWYATLSVEGADSQMLFHELPHEEQVEVATRVRTALRNYRPSQWEDLRSPAVALLDATSGPAVELFVALAPWPTGGGESAPRYRDLDSFECHIPA